MNQGFNNPMYPINYQNPYLNAKPAYTQNNGILWVQGVEGAKGYQMTPNSILLLMDSENDGVFYIKSTDNIGMSNLRTFKYSEVNTAEIGATALPDLSEYVKKDELQELIKNMIGGYANEQSVSTTVQERTVKSNAKH